MTNIITDLELLRRYMSEYGASQSISNNTLTYFYDAEGVYGWTNEPLKEYYAKDLAGKKVLSVTSSGDHILHAALAGAKDITGFDINRFAKYFAALKVALIKTYTYDDFAKMFSVVDDSIPFLLGDIKTSSAEIQSKLPVIYRDCNNCLTVEEKAFWEEYFKLRRKIHVPILKYLNRSHHSKNAYSKRENYNKLRKNLANCNIRYIDSNIDSLHDKTKDKFDLMYISNIIGSLALERSNEIFELIKGLQKNLNEYGIIYDYRMPFDSWIHYMLACESIESYNKILSKELPDFEVSTNKLTRGSICKFKYKGQPK